ncbi:MAG: hypothetical protein RLZ55_540 [Actinomycetota bacterium]
MPLAAAVSDGDEMAAGFAAIRAQLGVPAAFDRGVLAAAERWPTPTDLPRRDATELPLVTLDPPGARDLDQALFLERRGAGYRVWYAIADVPAFATPGGAVDLEAHRRGVTYYCPDGKVPLHPTLLSEDRASLLADQVRPAYLWCLDLDSDGSVIAARVERAMVRSRGQYDYPGVQGELEAGGADDVMTLLEQIGRLRQDQEAARGGVSLNLPKQAVVGDAGGYRLEFLPAAPVEGWNAQISLLTGICAAQIMLGAGVGLLRVMPPPAEGDVSRVRAVARSLRLSWPVTMTYPEFIRSLPPEDQRTPAMLTAATSLMRGAGYAQIEPEMAVAEHSAVAAPYAHVTAPLRRLVDRYGLAASAAICADEPVPEWVRAGLAELPALMSASDRRANALERANVDLVEAGVLAGREGEHFAAVGLSKRGRRSVVHVSGPAVIAACHEDVPLGAEVTVRLDRADVEARAVDFSLVG